MVEKLVYVHKNAHWHMGVQEKQLYGWINLGKITDNNHVASATAFC